MPRVGVVSLEELAQRRQPDRERAIAAVAERQHGVVTLDQLRLIGLSSQGVRYRVRSGRLRRLHRGVYVIPGAPISAHTRWMAAALACGPGAAVSHRSAAALWGFREGSPAVVDVSAPGRRGQRRPNLRLHRADLLHPQELAIERGIPCTSVARTLVDLGGVLRVDALEFAVHSAQTKRLVTSADVAAVLARSPNRPGTAALRRILDISLDEEERVRSPLERSFLRLCSTHGIPAPEVNRWIGVPNGDGLEVDFAWPRHRLIAELDSRAFHSTERAFENDRRRDRLLTAAGWRVVRFTARDLAERPDEVVMELRALLAAFVGVVALDH